MIKAAHASTILHKASDGRVFLFSFSNHEHMLLLKGVTLKLLTVDHGEQRKTWEKAQNYLM